MLVGVDWFACQTSIGVYLVSKFIPASISWLSMEQVTFPINRLGATKRVDINELKILVLSFNALTFECVMIQTCCKSVIWCCYH